MKTLDPITLRRVTAEIRDELKKLDDLFTEWESHRLGEWTDTFYLRGKASIDHDFYCGVENIFRRIAAELNGGLPNGGSWHKTLLQNMLLEIPEVRPSVVSGETGKLLKTFLEFHHKFCHVYGFDLDFNQLDDLERLYPETHSAVGADVSKFLQFVGELITDLEKNA